VARPIRLLTLTLIAVLVMTIAPAAQARQLSGNGGCITRDHVTAQGRSIERDQVSLTGKDKLTRWIDRNPAKAAKAAARVGGKPISIPVAFHVIRKDLTPEGGNVSDASIKAQIRVLNDSFLGKTGGAKTSFRFELTKVTRTTSKSWFNLTGVGPERAMKSALKVGGPETLNVYSANLQALLLGWAYLAQDADAVGVLDGVVIHYRTIPGVPNAYSVYGEGDTATHEVGHWLNLLHTFEGGCTEPGDHVDDTAPEASPAFGCPEGRDTCPGGGPDPITNFMDYTDDACMFEFTGGQAVRAQQAWTAYRAA
jgi:hypothetical protein